MNKEEKEAIEYFKSNLETIKEMGKRWGFEEEIKNNEILLNLIQKQEKEIHKLKIIIENMAEDLTQGCNYEEFEYQKQKIIESFKKEVEKE